jgi:hypothetical protein
MSKGDRDEFSGGEGMSEWRECKLGDFADRQTGLFGSQLHASDYVSEGHLVGASCTRPCRV